MKKNYLSAIIVLSIFILFSFISLALIPGDFNTDGKVDFEDLMIFALAYGSTSGSSNWNPVCDLDPDGKIDFEDLMIFAIHYGEHEQDATWTVMIYMDGDNNLDYNAWDDLSEMQSVGSSSEVNIVAQLDLFTSCSGTYRYYVTGVNQGSSYPLYPDDIVQTLPEQNMADPAVLNDFISWSMNHYPAEKYLLILWDHGGGWREENIPIKGVIFDDTSGDHMTMVDLVQGLEGIPDYIDILGFDACLMQMAEVYYEIESNLGSTSISCYGIGSQESEWGDGWPYDTILTDLTGNPSISENVLCETIVSNYINNCGSFGTLSALNFCSGINPVEFINVTDSFANALMNSSYQNEISFARLSTYTQSYYYPDYDYKDLYHFAENINDNVPDCQSEAQAVMNLVDDVVFANQFTGIGLDNSYGISIYLPDTSGDYDSAYDSLQFATDTLWDEFLKFGPTVVSGVQAQAVTYQATSMDTLQEKMEQLAVEGKIKDSYRLNELSPSTKGTTQHVIDITWHSYPDAEGYKIYRSVNTEGWEVYNWPAPSGHEWYSFRDNSVSEGNTYTYYVTAYGSGWETEPSEEVTIDTWLPPCSLVSPVDGFPITDLTPTFTWNPVGLSSFPHDSIVSGESDLWIYDTIASETAWYTWFNDMTSSSATYNQDGYATPLVSGHTYVWDSYGYGYDENWNMIAISQSEDWEFTYQE